MGLFQSSEVQGRTRQTLAATDADHLVRLFEARGLMAALFTGAWSDVTAYTAGVFCAHGGSLWLALIGNTDSEPAVENSNWAQAASGGATGAAGDSAYVYIAYASDAGGTGFTETFDANLNYIAILATDTEIGSRQASDFTGLWKNYKGATGAAGADGAKGDTGETGAAGDSAYVYIAYASDANGASFTETFNASLNYIAILATDTEIETRQASDFAGLWKNYKGATGAAGADGATGAVGAAGLTWVNAGWVSGMDMAVNDALAHNGSAYRCILAVEDAGADYEPGVGALWATAWQVLAAKGDAGSDGADGSDGAAGADGASAYVYTAYASDAAGASFTETFSAELNYIGILATATEIAVRQASDFAGLWKNYKGATGAAGADGAVGETGASAYVYIAYASDDGGTGFTLTYDANLKFIAIITSAEDIASPAVGDFADHWTRYGVDGGTYEISLGSGVDGGAVTGLELVSVPRVLCQVVKPPGGLNLFATVFNVTADGFNYSLSGETDGAGYKLWYDLR